MAKYIPDLGRKLTLLKDHTDFKSADILARHFGVSVSAFNEWRTGGSKGRQDSVPDKHVPKLVALLGEAFRRRPPNDELKDLLFGPANALEDAIRDDAAVLLEDILTAEAQRDTGRLHRQNSLGLVEHDEGDDDDTLPKVKIEERFLLEFDIQNAGYMLVVTNAQQDWGLVKFAEGGFSKRTPTGSVIVPGIAKGKPIPLYERNTRGIHRFMLFISPAPFPPVFSQAHAGRKNFDWTMLCQLARFYDQLPSGRREIHMLSIRMA